MSDERNLELKLRILLGGTIAMGPGKARLLTLIDERGSISAAARAMGMSYRRAWDLVNTMNQAFREPVVDTATGGSQGGGAELTEFGRSVLARYRDMERHAAEAVDSEIRAFESLLRETPPKAQD